MVTPVDPESSPGGVQALNQIKDKKYFEKYQGKGKKIYLKIVRLKSPLIYWDGGMIPQLYSIVKNFDIIHLHYPFFGGAEYVYLASLLKKNLTF